MPSRAARARPSSSSTSVATTVAPSRARASTSAAPCPRAAPVSTTTLPETRPMIVTSDRWRDEQAAVNIVEAVLGDQLAHRIGGAPLVLSHRVVDVVHVRVPHVLVEPLQL